MKNKGFNVGVVQTASSRNRGENLAKAISHIRDLASRGAQVICLQELFTTTYFCKTLDEAHFDMAEPIPGPTTDELCTLAKELKVWLIAPLFEKGVPGQYFNSAAVISSKGDIVNVYRKTHIPDDPGFFEKYYFTPGEGDYQVIETPFGNIAVLICWDQWFPEAARILALKGADVIFYPTAIGMLSSETEEELHLFHQAWQTVQRGHAVANGCFVVAVNRSGTEGDTAFWGRSFVSGPLGELELELGEGSEAGLIYIDIGKLEQTRITWPFLRDRRSDTYTGIVRKYLR